MCKIQIRINRNIVECKGRIKGNARVPERCINRNIVECKVRFSNLLCGKNSVLIETLWNVKAYLEKLLTQRLVLIETLWNVKYRSPDPEQDLDPVLIETLWNVKVDI